MLPKLVTTKLRDRCPTTVPWIWSRKLRQCVYRLSAPQWTQKLKPTRLYLHPPDVSPEKLPGRCLALLVALAASVTELAILTLTPLFPTLSIGITPTWARKLEDLRTAPTRARAIDGLMANPPDILLVLTLPSLVIWDRQVPNPKWALRCTAPFETKGQLRRPLWIDRCWLVACY